MPTALKAAEPTRYSDTSRGSTDPTGGVRRPTAQGRRVRCAGMKKRILVIALIVLTIVAAKKARHV